MKPANRYRYKQRDGVITYGLDLYHPGPGQWRVILSGPVWGTTREEAEVFRQTYAQEIAEAWLCAPVSTRDQASRRSSRWAFLATMSLVMMVAALLW